VIGGAIKNLGIGAQSKRGKFNVHLGGHPKYGLNAQGKFDPAAFKGKNQDPDWQVIEDTCPFGLFKVDGNDNVVWDREKCTLCLGCPIPLGAKGIIELGLETCIATDAAIADGALGAVKAVGAGKVGYINMAIDIVPACDCTGFADAPVVPHLGVFASKDPVAIDQACVDKTNEVAGIPGSRAEEMGVDGAGDIKFDMVSPVFEGMSQQATINTGELIGLGSRDYELVEVKPLGIEKFAFPPDPRRNRQRFQRLFDKFQPFPYDRHEGKGFDRVPEVDLSKINPNA
jgi:uncharacterized Fe-S center protein